MPVPQGNFTAPDRFADIPKNDKRGLQHLLAATGFSIVGLRAAWRNEKAFRQEATLAALLAPVALWLGQNGVQRALLIGALFLVLIVELLNSAVEAAVDRISHDLHVLSGQAKDMASAAVLLSLLMTVAVWAGIAWDRFSSSLPG